MTTSYRYHDTKSDLGSTKLENFGNLIDDTDEANVIIQVGGENNLEFKSFKAHSLVLCERSTYFRIALSDKWAKKEEDIYIFKKPNVAPKIFEIILKYASLTVNGRVQIFGFMYYGNVSLEHLDGPDSIALLIASDELELQRLCIHVQNHIKITLNDWLCENLLFVLDITSKHEDFDLLREHVLGIVCRDPHLIFSINNNYLLLSESTLINLLKRDDLGMEEIDIWEYLIKWGIEHTTSLNQNNHDLNCWSKDDFVALEETLHNCIPLIRFFQISSTDLYDKVRVPYKKILPKQLNEDIIKYFMKPGCEITTRILPSRLTIIDSSIIKLKHAGLISSWIDGNIHDNYHSNCKINYNFNLLVRGSRDGFDALTFHNRCDDKVGTVVIIKLKDRNKVVGGYNPCAWKRTLLGPLTRIGGYENAVNSFVFSFNINDDLKNAVLSKVVVASNAIYYSSSNGPCFGDGDLWMTGTFGSSSRTSYEHNIMDVPNFFANDYEVFQVQRR